MADILVAEDYPATRSALRTLLKSAGHTVRFAVNGEEALAQVVLKRPDLLLLDVMMPKKSGYEVLGEIRRTDAALPVILLTAKGEKSDVILGLGLGSDDYIKKPFDNDELLARVSAALRRAEVSAAPAAPREAASEAGDFIARRLHAAAALVERVPGLIPYESPDPDRRQHQQRPRRGT